jgi:hypothetical protein
MGIDNEASGTPIRKPRRRWWRSAIENFVLPLVAMSGAFALGWQFRGTQGPHFDESRHETVDHVLDQLQKVGLQCPKPIVRRAWRGGAGVGASCAADRRFDVTVSSSVAQAAEDVNLMYAVGCVNIAGQWHSQWYVAHATNWFVFTYDLDYARQAGRLPGVVVSTGFCSRSGNTLTPA